ncbi:hypothetical protein EDL99_09840 [Ornithobacterium rhinotracheale]|uniref:hypothetical protein n=1 Tax=Ornithobacterium rhinotracheale TaxID=28251 RepID=UPI00129C8D5C|nr:hypothetical protein [Ornithobacterium rhinotracheale]MRJ09157.1 hypothetical protein [Ornithobacterium rhinotracheale]UOH77258.1 hypothetical protein MT996_08550 [Ornithobacterium rhinotracheale]
MALNTERLKNKIIAAMDKCQKEEDNPNRSKEEFASDLARAIVEEIKELQIVYTAGLIAPSSGGPVTGKINAKIE